MLIKLIPLVILWTVVSIFFGAKTIERVPVKNALVEQYKRETALNIDLILYKYENNYSVYNDSNLPESK